MVKTVKYSSVESIKYLFTTSDILDALLKQNKILIKNNEYIYEMFEKDDQLFFELVVYHKKEIDKP